MTSEETTDEIDFLWDRHTIALCWLRRKGFADVQMDKHGCLHFTTRVPLEIEIKMCVKAHMDEVARILRTEVAGYVVKSAAEFEHRWTVSFKY